MRAQSQHPGGRPVTIAAMSPGEQQHEERRQGLRFAGDALQVALRRRGRFGVIPAEALDFNRFGIAVRTTRPMGRDRPVFMSLRCGAVQIHSVVGVVHNCVREGRHFRCGIRFRLGSALQLDRQRVEALLARLEEAARQQDGVR